MAETSLGTQTFHWDREGVLEMGLLRAKLYINEQSTIHEQFQKESLRKDEQREQREREQRIISQCSPWGRW